MIETMKRAYADRAKLLGDPDVRESAGRGPDVEALRRGAAQRPSTRSARRRRARSSPGEPRPFEGGNTTHYSVVDRFGNAVSNTYTLNLSYGVGLVADGTGVLLNNELDDFAAKPGAPNAFGLVGLDEANAPAGGKRPLSSMTPTIVLKDGKPLLVTGSPGGSRIITAVLQRAAQRDRPPHEHRRGGAARRASIINGCRTRSASSRACRQRPCAALAGARPQGRATLARHLGELDHGDARGLIGAADTRTRGALAAGY